jgi:hypothetical protein
VSSGKQTIFLDGKEIHCVVPRTAGGSQVKMECDLIFGNHHVMKHIAHASPPAVHVPLDGSEQRQFDFLLDGLSFFEFSKLFELGCAKKTVAGHKNEIGPSVATGTSTDNSAFFRGHQFDGRALQLQNAQIF